MNSLSSSWDRSSETFRYSSAKSWASWASSMSFDWSGTSVSSTSSIILLLSTFSTVCCFSNKHSRAWTCNLQKYKDSELFFVTLSSSHVANLQISKAKKACKSKTSVYILNYRFASRKVLCLWLQVINHNQMQMKQRRSNSVLSIDLPSQLYNTDSCQ